MSTHGPIDDNYRATMNALAEALDEVFNGKDYKKKGRNVGYALLTFPIGENIKGTGRVNYIGNCARSDMLVALKELIARWEGRHPEESGQQTDGTKQ